MVGRESQSTSRLYIYPAERDFYVVSFELTASPPLSPGEDFLAKDLGRGPYLAQSLNSHLGHPRQVPPTPQPGHRQTYSQNSATPAQGRRMDSYVSWIPFDPTMESPEVRSPVPSFTAGLSVRGGSGNKASAEDILRGSTLCALYLVSGLPKVRIFRTV